MFSSNFEGKNFSISPWFWPRLHRGCRINWRHLQKMSFSRIWMVFGSFPVCIRRVRSTKIAQNVCFWGFPYIYSQPRRFFGGVGPLHTMGFENPRRNRIREGRFGKVSISLDRVQVFRAKKIFERTRKKSKNQFFRMFSNFSRHGSSWIDTPTCKTCKMPPDVRFLMTCRHRHVRNFQKSYKIMKINIFWRCLQFGLQLGRGSGATWGCRTPWWRGTNAPTPIQID